MFDISSSIAGDPGDGGECTALFFARVRVTDRRRWVLRLQPSASCHKRRKHRRQYCHRQPKSHTPQTPSHALASRGAQSHSLWEDHRWDDQSSSRWVREEHRCRCFRARRRVSGPGLLGAALPFAFSGPAPLVRLDPFPFAFPVVAFSWAAAVGWNVSASAGGPASAVGFFFSDAAFLYAIADFEAGSLNDMPAVLILSIFIILRSSSLTVPLMKSVARVMKKASHSSTLSHAPVRFDVRNVSWEVMMAHKLS